LASGNELFEVALTTAVPWAERTLLCLSGGSDKLNIQTLKVYIRLIEVIVARIKKEEQNFMVKEEEVLG
jgi:hypothetical protein